MKLVLRGLMQRPVSILQCSQRRSRALKTICVIRWENTQKVALFIFNAPVALQLRGKKSKLRMKSEIL